MRGNIKTYLLQLALFLMTVYTTTSAGATLIGVPTDSYWEFFTKGFWFSVPFLGILTVHEFGHYIAARLYKVKVTLPYYIPFFTLIGTLGAFIRIKSMPKTRQQYFDIGIAGPLAGFVIAIGILIYAFTHLPPLEYIYSIHEDYREYGANYGEYVYKEKVSSDSTMLLAVGDNLLFKIFEETLVEDKALIPHEYEMMHYPLLFAGYLALFFTALNLLPIGQLDGGHVLYGLFGTKKHKIISDIFYVLLVTIGGVSLFNLPVYDFVPMATFENFMIFAPIYLALLYLGFFAKLSQKVVTNLLITVLVFVAQYAIAEYWSSTQGFLGYLVFAFIIGRFVGTGHPPSLEEKPLSTGRKLLGWFALLVFVLSFSFQPIYIVT